MKHHITKIKFTDNFLNWSQTNNSKVLYLKTYEDKNIDTTFFSFFICKDEMLVTLQRYTSNSVNW